MAPPGRRRFAPTTLTSILALLFLFATSASAAGAVLGIDLGSAYLKAVIVKPGIPLEIVLTKDSKRKEAAAVAFKPLPSTPAAKVNTEGDEAADALFPERAYGPDALALAARFPAHVYPNLKPLLGVPLNGTLAVDVWAKRHPAVELVETPGRPTVSIRSTAFGSADKSEIFSVEEVLAMQLQEVRNNARAMAGKGTDVSEVVFAVPSYFTADEKRALEVAARLAGLKVLGLVTDGLAVGLNFATTRTFPDVTQGGKPEYHLVFDMGAGSTTASVVRFQSRSVKDVGRFNKTVQEVAVLGTGWDRSLGGDALNSLIVDDMITKFLASPAGKQLGATVTADDIHQHGRTKAKLWREAEKLRHVLSANQATGASFESLYEDADFKYKLSRADFETMAASFAARVEGPLVQALKSAELTWANIDSVILHGGASRTPFIQKELERLVGDEGKLRSSVNADEAAVFGAAFKGASLSPSFRVREIRDADTTGYPVGVQYMWNMKDRLLHLFNPTSKLGVIKDIPFTMYGEFDFTLYQTVPHGEEPARTPIVHIRTGNQTRVVADLIDKQGCDRDHVDTKFSIRLSPVDGLPEAVKGWVHCDVTEEPKKEGVMDSVKGFFGFGDKDKKDSAQVPLKDGESADAASSDGAADASSSAPESSSSSSSSSSSAPASESTDAAEKAEKKEEADAKPKTRTISSPVTFHVTQKGYEKHPRKEMKRMQDRLSAFDNSDKARRSREELHNSLEAYTYKARDHLEDADFIRASTDEVRAQIEALIASTRDWLYEDGADASTATLKQRYRALTDLVEPISLRKAESLERPSKIKALADAIEHTRGLTQLIAGKLKSAEQEASASSAAAAESSKSAAEAAASATPEAGSSSDPLAELEEDPAGSSSSSSTTKAPKPSGMPAFPTYTQNDLDEITKIVDEAAAWLKAREEEQASLSPHQDAAMTVRELEEKAKELEELVTTVIQNRMRAPKKEKKSTKSKSKKTKTSKAKSAKTEEKKESATLEVPKGEKTNTIKLGGDIPFPPKETDRGITPEELQKLMADFLEENPEAKEEKAEKKHDEL